MSVLPLRYYHSVLYIIILVSLLINQKYQNGYLKIKIENATGCSRLILTLMFVYDIN